MLESRVEGSWINSIEIAVERWNEPACTYTGFLEVLIGVQFAAKSV